LTPLFSESSVPHAVVISSLVELHHRIAIEYRMYRYEGIVLYVSGV
jgi:hypothetical protein